MIKNISLKFIAELFLCCWILMFSLGVSSLGSLPLKNIFSSVFISASLILLISRKHLNFKYSWLLFFVFVGILISLVLGIFNGYYLEALNQASVIISSFMMVIFSFTLFHNSLLNINKIERVIYLTAKSAILMKVTMVALVMMGVLSSDALNQIMESYFGAAGFDMSSYTGFMGLIPRIGNSGDIVYIIIFTFYMMKNNGRSVFYFWLLTLALVLISNSRYLIIIFGLVSTFAIYVIFKNMRHNIFSILIFILLFTSFFIISPNTEAYSYVLDRFTGGLSVEADIHRIDQGYYISRVFLENPFLGIGMGGYVNDFIRNENRLWQYELEYLSMLMQFGFFGFVLIVISYILYCILIIFSNNSPYLKAPIFLGLLFWIVTPIQSALFIGGSSAFIVLSIFFLSRNVCKDVRIDSTSPVNSTNPRRTSSIRGALSQASFKTR
ncbi:hypothetical protein M2244_002354 [Rhodoferax antarcticus]|nr:hypothetical protein [Rhodoferax antarcticus]